MNLSRFANTCVFVAKKHAPTIMVFLGIGGIGYGTYKACKATKKVDPIIEEHKINVAQIHMAEHIGKDIINKEAGNYTVANVKKDLTKQYLKTGSKLAKLYAPTAVIMGSSIALILGSHKILNGRNAALGAAYATLDKAYKEYRGKVIEKYGDDADKEINLGIKKNKTKGKDDVKYKVVNPETMRDLNEGYTRFFDKVNVPSCFDDNPLVNKKFILAQQKYANDRLRARRVVFLNEALESLGYEPTAEGQVVGWVYDENNPNKIDFGIYNITNEARKDFLSGMENSILLEFNVDGYVLDKIGLKR